MLYSTLKTFKFCFNTIETFFLNIFCDKFDMPIAGFSDAHWTALLETK